MKSLHFHKREAFYFRKHESSYNIILTRMKSLHFHKCESSYNIILVSNKIILHLQEQSVTFLYTQSSSSLLIRDDV